MKSVNVSELNEFRLFCRAQTQQVRTLLCARRADTLLIDTKPDNSLVTELDREIEHRLRRDIMKHFPDHGVLGEEFGTHLADARYQWVIDPIDGTQEFANGSGFYGFLLSLNLDGNPILGLIDHPALDLTLEADLENPTRCNGKLISINNDHAPRQGIVMPAVADYHKYADEHALFNKIINEYSNYRVYRSCYGHTSTLLGHTCLTVEHDLRLWDFNSTRLLVQQAGGRFEILRKRIVDSGAEVYSVVFGVAEQVQRFLTLFARDYRA